MPPYTYRLIPLAAKQFKKLPRQLQIRIIKKVKFFCQTEPLYYAEKLTDKEIGEFRFRIGNYRVIFDLQDQMITILKIGHRREIYR